MILSETTFVYRPRSGDRALAERPGPEIRIVTWPNGSRHIQGGVHLRYPAADSGNWWRGYACTMAKAIVQATSGFAWDNQGVVNLIVPRFAAYQASEYMLASAQAAGANVPQQDKLRNDAMLISHSVAWLIVDKTSGYHTRLVVEGHGAVGDSPAPQSLPTYREELPLKVEGGDPEVNEKYLNELKRLIEFRRAQKEGAQHKIDHDLRERIMEFSEEAH